MWQEIGHRSYNTKNIEYLWIETIGSIITPALMKYWDAKGKVVPDGGGVIGIALISGAKHYEIVNEKELTRLHSIFNIPEFTGHEYE